MECPSYKRNNSHFVSVSSQLLRHVPTTEAVLGHILHWKTTFFKFKYEKSKFERNESKERNLKQGAKKLKKKNFHKKLQETIHIDHIFMR